jgi:enoyl-CoA hydratase/carnithine racemase
VSGATAEPQVRVEKAGGVLTVTLARPEKKNALTPEMYAGLTAALRSAEEDREVRVVLLQAEGDAFCAGNDLAEFSAVSAGQAPRSIAAKPFLDALVQARAPLVAAVQGLAVGVGVTMLLHCDLVFVAEDARLSAPFANLALTPEAASSLLLPARIGHVRAFSMFALGEAIDGRTAAAWGLANAALPAGEVQTRARAAAEALARRPPASIGATKALMREVQAYASRMEAEFVRFGDQLRSEEAKEAFAAFYEKRPADFSRF